MNESITYRDRPTDEKFFGKYRGLVIDNRDPLKLGRLKVSVPSILSEEVTVWALPCFPYGGSHQQGIFMVPDIDSHVWVEFEAGDIDHPIWAGTFWEKEGDAPDDSAREDPTTRLIQTGSGHILQFDDEGGEEQIRLHHPADAEFLIDASGSITLTDTSGAILRMDAENNEIILEDANGNILTMNSAGSKIEDSNGNVLEMTAAGITAEALKIVIKGSQVHLGDEGGEPIIKGQSFLSMFATHIHTVAPVVGGPTSPPIPQGEMSTLSTTVKAI
jgi:hypothetical protein